MGPSNFSDEISLEGYKLINLTSLSGCCCNFSGNSLHSRSTPIGSLKIQMKVLTNTTRQYRPLLVIALALAFATLTFCHLRDSKSISDASTTSTRQNSTAAGNLPNSGIADEDADQDGLPGSEDACPDRPGAAIDNGCPIDTDNDGFTDSDDQCPTQAGAVEGCPEDDDKDGLSNSEDKCPSAAGPVANQGCPTDSDGDGVGDATDQCPQTVGQVAHNGCLPNSESEEGSETATLDQQPINRPAEPSVAALVQCGSEDEGINVDCPPPDQVPVAADSNAADSDPGTTTSAICSQLADSASYADCMQSTQPDADEDGVADADDQCPSTPGDTPEGCPTKKANPVSSVATLDPDDQQILDEALASVAFDSNNATLTPESRKLLTAVAGLLRKYPTATLEIRGHTDASGDADENMQLSMARARSSAAHIVSVGINVNRLKAFGYGESRPIADNANVEGRRKNRRVEFELLFDQ